MDDVLHNTLDVSVLLRVVDVPQLGGRLVVVRVGLEDPTRLPLGSDDSLQTSASHSSSVPYFVLQLPQMLGGEVKTGPDVHPFCLMKVVEKLEG